MEKLDKMRVEIGEVLGPLVLTQGDLSQAGAGLDGARVRSWSPLLLSIDPKLNQY